MKSIASILVCAGAILFAACSSQPKSEKEQQKTLIKDNTLADNNQTPERMQVSDKQENVVFRGKEYRSSVTRRPDESLPLVKNEEGERFIDNRIYLRLTGGGKTVIDKAFTKADFAQIVDARFLQHAILEGLVFDHTTPQGFVYAASVAYPNSDLYVPLRLTITPDGKIQLSKDELMEEPPAEEEENKVSSN